ncbi:hypothetical protein NA57DRAFT_59823 [Rhizodiscina lignyota]|uniref:Uncharacterized protein n=1 Tax=Rhizodiscina lignyota TaxID=1504668 RepID=A0A9P4IB68_9PEZI|nr:hypothetical protein NA57DRAFT_59823 [Rhizodiscina lignyota]
MILYNEGYKRVQLKRACNRRSDAECFLPKSYDHCSDTHRARDKTPFSSITYVNHPEFIGIYANDEQFERNIDTLEEVAERNTIQIATDWLRKPGKEKKVSVKNLQLVVKQPARKSLSFKRTRKWMPTLTADGKTRYVPTPDFYHIHQARSKVWRRAHYHIRKHDPDFKEKQLSAQKRCYKRNRKDPAWVARFNANALAWRNAHKDTPEFKTAAALSDAKKHAKRKAEGRPAGKFRECIPCGKWIRALPAM